MNIQTKMNLDLKKFTKDPIVYIGFTDSENDSNSEEVNINNHYEEKEEPQKFLGNKRKITFKEKDMDPDNIMMEKSNLKNLGNAEKNVFEKKIENNVNKINGPKNFICLKNDVKTFKMQVESPKKIVAHSPSKINPNTSSNTRSGIFDKKSKINSINSINENKKLISPHIVSNIQIKKENIYDNIYFEDQDDDGIKIEKKEEFKLIVQIQKFKASFQEFIDNENFIMLRGNFKENYINNNIERLLKLYEFVKENGGFESVIGELSLNKFIKENRYYSNYEEARKDLNQYLYHYICYMENPKMDEKEAKELCLRDPSMLIECSIIQASIGDTEEEIHSKIKESMKYDLVILRGFLPVFGLDNKIFSLDYISNKFNLKNKIDVIEQPQNFYGFNPKKLSRKKMTLGDYFKYVKSHNSAAEKKKTNQKTIKKSNKQHDEIIYYGVNVELTEYAELHKQLEKKVHPLILFGSNYDPLAYVRQHIKGMTIPQMYIKVQDVWTGGHEENLRMRSVNINHGPGDSLWWGTPVEDSYKLSQKVEKIYNTNIYKKEGIWFPEINFFYINRIKVFYTIQRSGDIVLVGQGTIHWVKAKSHSINTSWNFGSKDSRSLKMSMERYAINKEIKMRSLVPMETLILDILNNEIYDLDLDFVQTCSNYLLPAINNSISENETIKNELMKKYNLNMMKELESYLVENCEDCLVEIFNCWSYCQFCSNKSNEVQVILCINCFKDHIKMCNKSKSQFIFFKYEEKDLLKLKERIDFKLKYNNQLTSYDKELKEVQTGLLKKTKDSNNIKEKKINKIVPQISNETIYFQQEYPAFFKEVDAHDVSSNLVPIIDIDKLRSEDFKSPLKAEAINWENPYMMFEDLIEDINLSRFSPIREKIKKYEDPYEDCQMQDHTNEINYHNEEKNYSLFNQDNNFSSYGDYNIKPSNYYKQVKYNFHSNLPGTSLINSLIFEHKSSNSNPDISDTLSNRNSQIGKSINNPIISPIQILLRDSQSLQKLKNGLNTKKNSNSNSSNYFPEKKIETQETFNLKTNEEAEKATAYNPFIYNMERVGNVAAVQQIKKAKIYLTPLTDRDKASQYKFVSDLHTNILAGKEIIINNINNKELIEETKLKFFIEKIINNENLITKYREIFREEIYEKL